MTSRTLSTRARPRRTLPLGVLLLLLLGTRNAAAQQVTTIGFEKDCAGVDTPGTFAPETKPLPIDLYAPCGVATITSAGMAAQLVAPTTPVEGITNSVALMGPGLVDAGISGELAFNFMPPVHEVSFDVLDLDSESGIEVSLTAPESGDVVQVRPVPTNGRVHFTHTSQLGIARVALLYGTASDTDGWFVDQLEFNSWKCGDGEHEAQAGEACDDGNGVQCDGCDSTCKASTVGCLDGTTCVARASSSGNGCSFCDANKTPEPSGEVLISRRAAETACDDELFCTLAGVCDGGGNCQTRANPCSDELACTVDSCDEQVDQCRHVLDPQWCLIEGACYPNGTPHPTNPCEFCASQTGDHAWSKQAAGYQCGDPACTNGMETAAATCDAAGTCQSAAPRACSDAMCADARSCRGTCNQDLDCTQQTHCVASTAKCAPDLATGQACTHAGECTTGFCVDGVCCNGLCAGSCESCNQPGSVGGCTPLAAMSTDPELRCGAGQLCGSGGQCLVQLEIGALCDTDALCASGRCVDGVCCDAPCGGVCESCNMPGQAGVCSPHALGTDPGHECGTASVCTGQRSCVPGDYEMRGGGLCAARPAVTDAGGPQPAHQLTWGVLALLSALRTRRRRPRVDARKRNDNAGKRAP